MPRVAVNNVIDTAAKIKATWSANPTFALGEMTLATFNTVYDSVTQQDAAIESKRHELQGLLDQRDDRAKELKDLSTRALSGFRAVYGPDSPQYDQAGGTRRSERAPTRRQAQASAKT